MKWDFNVKQTEVNHVIGPILIHNKKARWTLRPSHQKLFVPQVIHTLREGCAKSRQPTSMPDAQ
jgi:hypothetical protein